MELSERQGPAGAENGTRVQQRHRYHPVVGNSAVELSVTSGYSLCSWRYTHPPPNRLRLAQVIVRARNGNQI